MIEILTLIAFIAIIGMCVWFITTLPMPVIFKNLIYLVVAIGAALMLIHFLQSGHLPSVRL